MRHRRLDVGQLAVASVQDASHNSNKHEAFACQQLRWTLAPRPPYMRLLFPHASSLRAKPEAQPGLKDLPPTKPTPEEETRLSKPVRTQESHDQEANGGSEDDGEGGRMEDLPTPLLVLCKVLATLQVGVDEHQRRGS